VSQILLIRFVPRRPEEFLQEEAPVFPLNSSSTTAAVGPISAHRRDSANDDFGWWNRPTRGGTTRGLNKGSDAPSIRRVQVVGIRSHFCSSPHAFSSGALVHAGKNRLCHARPGVVGVG
jgi:hypothetical protein